MTENKAIEKSVNSFAVQVAKIWEDKEQIKALFAPDLTQKEFDMFVGLGMSMGANPFNREIWAVKYGGRAQIFTGRDFDRIKAQDQPDYGGHGSMPIYENDEHHYNPMTGEIVYKPAKRSERGKLVGAFGYAWRKGIDRPFYVFCEFSEYDNNQSLWKEDKKPSTMIKKVSESQVLRMAWQAAFKGTYGEAEQWKSNTEEVKKYQQEPPTKEVASPKEQVDDDVIDGEAVEEEPVVSREEIAERLAKALSDRKERKAFVKRHTGKDAWADVDNNDLGVLDFALSEIGN